MLGERVVRVSPTPRSMHMRRLRRLAVSAAGLMGIGGLGCAPSSPTTGSGSDDRGMAMSEANHARLSAPSARPVDALPGSAGPAGSLAGIRLDDGNEAFVLGTITNDVLSVSGIVLQDSNGQFIMQQNVYGNGTAVIFATGDQVEIIDSTDGTAQLKLTLNATSPATVLYATVDPQNNITTFEGAWSQVYNDPNPAYENQQTTARQIQSLRDTAIGETPPGVTPPCPISYDLSAEKTRRQTTKPSCASLGNSLVNAANLACDAKSLMTRKLPEFIVNGICVGALRTFETLKDPEAPETVRVTAFVKWSVTVLCEGLKAGIGVANVFTKFNPFDLACFVLNYVDETVQVQTGETLADKLCQLMGGSSDQDGEEEEECPVNEFRAANGECVACPEDSGGCPANQYRGQDGSCYDIPPACLVTTSAGCGPDQGSESLRIEDVQISQYVGPPYGDHVTIYYFSEPASRLDVVFEPCSLPGVACAPNCPAEYRVALSITPNESDRRVEFDYQSCGTGPGSAEYRATIINPATGATASKSLLMSCSE